MSERAVRLPIAFNNRVWLLPALFLAIAPAALGAEHTYPPDIRKILDRKRLIVALPERDQPPFFWYDPAQKQHRGFDVELAQQIAVRLGLGADAVEFNREAKSFNGVIDVVQAGRADVAICKLSATLARSRRMLFTSPYVVLRKGLLINRLRFARLKRGRSPAEAIRDFRGRVAVIANSSYEGYAREMFLRGGETPAQIDRRIALKKNWEEVIRAVESGEVDAAFRDELEIKKVFRQRPDVAIRLQSVVFKDTRDPIAIAVDWKSTHLHKWLQLFLHKHFTEHLRLGKTQITADELLDRYKEIFEEGGADHRTERTPAGRGAAGDGKSS